MDGVDRVCFRFISFYFSVINYYYPYYYYFFTVCKVSDLV